MNDNDVPILRKIHELYKTFHEYRNLVPKQDRFTVYERTENIIVDILELVLEASYVSKERKSLDLKKYALLQGIIDEIGRMLGGWIKSQK